MGNMADGLGFAPRVKEPESALEPGMAAPAPRMTVDALLGPGLLDMPDTSGPGAVQAPSPAHWVYDFDPATKVSRATYNGEVSFTTGGSSTAGVTSWNTRTGAVALTLADITGAGGAPIDSPAFTGTPTAPTRLPGDSSTAIATTAFVNQALTAGPEVTFFNGRTGSVTLNLGDVTGAGGAPVMSPSFQGVPTTPTPTQGDASSKVASTQFVSDAIGAGAVTSWNGRKGGVSLTLSDVQSVGGAPVNSPNFTGTPTGPTPTVGDATTKLATTAFVTNAVSSATAGVASFNTRTGAVTLTTADVIAAGGAPIVSPTFTGTPAAPTPTAGDSSTKVATTAFVEAAIASLPSGVTSFNGRTGVVALQLTDVTSVGGAPIAAPTFTGIAQSPTPTAGDNSQRIATTAFVAASFAPITSVAVKTALTPLMNGTAAIGSDAAWAAGNHVHPSDTSKLSLSGGTMTGGLTVPAFTSTGGVNAVNGVGIAMDGPTSQSRVLRGSVAGSPRWDINLGNGAAEGGTATGSDFQLSSYNNAGAFFASPIVVSRGNSQIALNGNVLNTTGSITSAAAGGGNASIFFNSAPATVQGQIYWDASAAHMTCYFPGGAGQYYFLDNTGAFQISGANAYKIGGGAWAASSDERIKTAVADYGSGLEHVLQLRPVTYRYRGNDTPTADGNRLINGDTAAADRASDVAPFPASAHYQAATAGQTFVGLIAQEVEAIFPGMVTKTDGFIDGAAVADLRQLDTGELIFALVNAVKTLAARVEVLEATT
jgi:Chaperone of endosialidase